MRIIELNGHNIDIYIYDYGILWAQYIYEYASLWAQWGLRNVHSRALQPLACYVKHTEQQLLRTVPAAAVLCGNVRVPAAQSRVPHTGSF